MYSVSIENSMQSPLDINDTIIEPKLKSAPSSNFSSSSIVFSLFNDNDTSSLVSLPFAVDESTGVIRLRKPLSSHPGQDDKEKLFAFGIKATYRHLEHQSTSSYYSYMLPAYAKIQISVRSPSTAKDLLAPRPNLSVRADIISPFVSRYEILNEDSNNQTLILFINDPFSVHSKLVKLYVQYKQPTTGKR